MQLLSPPHHLANLPTNLSIAGKEFPRFYMVLRSFYLLSGDYDSLIGYGRTTLKRRNPLQSKLFRTLEHAEVLANAPIDFYAVKIEMGRLGILGATFQALENEILVTCPQQEFYAQQAELTSMLNLYKLIKLKLMRLLNCDDTAVQLPAVPALCQPHHDAHPTVLEIVPPHEGQMDEKPVVFLAGFQTAGSDNEDLWQILVKSFENQTEVAQTQSDFHHPSHNYDSTVYHMPSLKLNLGTVVQCLRMVFATTEVFIPKLNFAHCYQHFYSGT